MLNYNAVEQCELADSDAIVAARDQTISRGTVNLRIFLNHIHLLELRFSAGMSKGKSYDCR